MSGMSKAQEYRQHAEDCRREAERCSTPVEKNHWLVLADQWLSMAQDLDCASTNPMLLETGDASGGIVGTGSRKGMVLG